MERMQTHRLRGPGVKGSREDGVGKLEGGEVRWVRPGRAGSLLGDGVAAGPEEPSLTLWALLTPPVPREPVSPGKLLG